MEIEWVTGSEIRVSVENNTVLLSANKEGLLSLAKQFTAMAQAPTQTHIHYDEFNSLEDGSTELIVEKT